ncbi:MULTISPECIES: hypothetical protein [Leptolyngbya]|jgi:hypothetical protein|uniref:Uncharacterized protein n=2 Tax=Leptolyngbya boryana TaxID=1184 RepID=A0A1Z4JMK3_LEPBY|nr:MULTISPECIES: hypothetical protein [Leptolyngbya]BAY57878.1 hypothetical protein NIES2135_47490 [Leptolyngbya boryana NIES-2135]MBD1856603.1 hypothetical protein [Leptolyngbya sp. FACHB-1624]MBD2367323.1 hypothetical protein [Leptolyngbya sp. FACHB-161]MBD2373848.1 hypothetical protein [Leptolyngbya sp. FACHB-238]MBD2398353.1 hypothetical protein [Leptolyngbya sp. FACHB-239]
MNATKLDTLAVIVKVMVASLILSIVIKYLAPFAEIPPTTLNVLFAVLSPTAILAIVLLLNQHD